MYRILLLMIYFSVFVFANEKVVLQLKWFHQFQFAGYYAAKEKGFYKEVGLDVEIRQRDLKYNNIQQVIDNEAQYGISDSVLLLYKAKKEPIVIISPIFQHSPSVIISLKGNNTDSVYELDKKDMVFYENDNDGFSILAMLKKLGVKPNMIRGREKDDYKKLIDKKTDAFPAYLSNEPFYFRQKNININVFDPRNYGFDLYGDMLFTNENEVKNNPNRVKRFKEATLKGWEYALENKDEIIELIHNKYNKNKSIEHLKFEADAIERVVSKETTPLGTVDKGRIKYIHSLYKDYGLINAKIDVKDFIFDDYGSKFYNIDFTEEEKEYLKNHPTLTIPNMNAFAPFSYNENGKALGYSIDYMKLMAKKMGVSLNIIQGKTWVEYLSMLKNGKLDVIPHIAFNKQRDKFVDFTSFAHLSFSTAIALKKSNDFKTMKDLEERVLAVQNRTFHHTFFEENLPTQRLLLVSSSKEGIKAVSEGKADAMIGNLPALEYYIQNEWLSDLKTSRIEGSGLITQTSLYMGVQKGNLLLKSILEKVHLNIEHNEELILKKKWLSLEKKHNINLTSDELSYLKEKKELKMCIDPNWMPYERIENGKHEGITSDYIKIFKENLSINIKLIPTKDWIETISYGKSRKCDFITVMVRTKERLNHFNFSREYLETPLVIATKIDEPFINDVSSVKDKRFGIVKGYAYKQELEKKYPGINIVDVNNVYDGLEKVDNGKLFGFIDSLPVIGYEIQKEYAGNLKVAGKINGDWSFSIASRNDEPLLNDIFSKVIKSIPLEEHNKILHKWISVKYQESIDYTKFLWMLFGFFVVLSIVIYKNRSINELNQQMTKYINIVDENILTSTTDLSGKITSASEAFCKISGYTKEELLGKPHNIIRHEDMNSEVFDELWKTISNGKTWKGEIKNKKKDGGYYWVDATISPNFDKKNRIIGYTSIRQDITNKKIVEYLSITDELTTLYNKRYFNEIFEKEINRIKRDEKRIGFMIFDVDHFKQYNDTYGHQKGDEVLRAIGRSLKKVSKRSTDTTCRIGGEEFAVIFHPHFKESAVEFAEIIKESIENLKIEHKYNSASKYITVSIGLYTAIHDNIKSSKEIYKLTDDALYKAKKEGRNRIYLVDKNV